MTLFFLTLIFSVNMFGQSSKPQVDGSWKIKSIFESGKMIDMMAKETIVEISVKDKNILIYVGCNRITSKFEFITSDMIKPLQLVTTRKSCQSTITELESSVRYVLEQVNSVRKSGARVEFFKDTNLLMVIERPTDVKKKK
ncbi:MAG TPA: META domain-containing protein [Cytophagaceae bacterium]|nr:META domain-containing protein [Cytophagaceae bacterium]